ncbi:MAG TPA: bifunctional [glutamate--ammonia ligase]-adenylyl-L-tyrosine phosphorylase/[glutamate--ammonia-ligase] adenylyltransferase [Nitrospirae bacterium]|nr:bifunctional [glutamate--ammonia ligase]-adenylyl-L-tyrosine phosphorylase/[glutamate--ammonia-ligase] adenylyltransferase [Nitrospirota bacterium]
MPINEGLHKRIEELSLDTPDPVRAERNTLSLFELTPAGPFLPYLAYICRLFAVSQFLAVYCIANPEELLAALKEIKRPGSKELLSERIRTEVTPDEPEDLNGMMKALRGFKKRYLLRITLRDLAGETGILSSIDELTLLAEAIISLSLQWSLRINCRRFGEPANAAITVIGLGKLGGAELNYSSDVDLIAVYSQRDGQTPGILNPSGVRVNRISNHEFYCRLMELLNRMLSLPTEDGIAYRVDLRLRPQGQKGELILPLDSYQRYYESWGRTWERMVLIRARPVAGDMGLGQKFMEVISPFVWRESLDFSEIEEIRGLKKRIDLTFSRDDIKRGYGGIREIEFFVQTFQLIYGGDNRGLRTHRLFNAIQELRLMKLVPQEDLATLWDNYLYLRRLEHYLQMKEDLQTHALPASGQETEVLARMMGFFSAAEFLADLRLRRMQVKNMYNSLLGTEEDLHAEALTLLEGDLADDELMGYLLFRGIKAPQAGLIHLRKVREQMRTFKTQKERAILRRVVPQFLEKAFNAESPDRVLKGLESFIAVLGEKEAYLTGVAEHKGLIDAVVKLFSLSSYLSRVFLSSNRYLDTLVEGLIIRKTKKQVEAELRRSIRFGKGVLEAIGEYRRAEEIRLGLFFLMDVLTIHDLLRYLSHLADAIIGIILERINDNQGFSIIGLGKLGGRELTFGSDLDIIFLSDIPDGVKAAESVVKTLTTYTDRGMLYNVDVRLRPDGSKGALIKDIAGYRNYYLRSAHPWELQALLRARPVAGDLRAGRAFMEMGREVLMQRGKEVKREDIHAMRQRIVSELSQEAAGMDIKLGPGGIEEIEFHVQFLQLQHVSESPEVAVQNTPVAINRLAKKGILNTEERETLFNAYEYYRRLETFLRLNEEHVIVKDSGIAELAGIFMGHGSKDEFLTHIGGLRSSVLRVTG